MKRKIRYLHLSDNFYPVVTGGTEIFIQQLIDVQLKLSKKYDVIWACHKSSDGDYRKIKKIESYKKLLDPVILANRLERFSFKAKSIEGFNVLLRDFKPDIVHIHSLGSRTTLNHIEAIKKFGSKILFTIHTPPCSCMGNLLNASHKLCDGVLNDSRCTFFRLRSIGLPYLISKLISFQNGWPLSPNQKNIVSRILTSRKLTSNMHFSWMKLMNDVDLIHVLSDWQKEMLIRQKVNINKIKLIRTAGPKKLPHNKISSKRDDLLKLVFWGRCNPQKGIHIVIDAILRLPSNSRVRLDFYGPYWGDTKYSREMISKISNDKRFKLCGNLPQKTLLKKLQNYDLAVIPSIWMETGPLSVLEAFAAGIPVAGSDLGGIKELLEDKYNCFLLPPKIHLWSELFNSLIKDKTILKEFKSPLIRTFNDIENDLFNILKI